MVIVSPELNRRMRAIPRLISAEVKPVMEACAAELVALMQALVPVDEGDLRASIGWAWGSAPKGAMVLDSVEAKKNASDRIVIYAGDPVAFYARFVEFGTQAHAVGAGSDVAKASGKSGAQSGAMHPGARAQPFFWPAYRAKKKSIRRRIADAVRRGIANSNR